MTRQALVKKKANKVITERKTNYTTTSLILDVDKCQGCNLCWTICPQYAIERGPIGASIRGRTNTPPIRINYYRCVFCGLCAYICPFNALKLEINGKPAQKIREGVSIPKLEGDLVQCQKTGEIVKKSYEGEIILHEEKCPSGCSTCIDVCPSRCIELPLASKDKPWENDHKLQVNHEDCLFCGACVFACPSPGAIELKRTEIKHSKEGSESQLWINIEKKLTEKVSSRDWFSEERLEMLTRGEKKLPPKRKHLKD
ncbi:MAG: 4Fe-4S binding protein [Asgard group archaeon]|nr:4Fe-4S binding protein [Asgard group archaeon]